MKKKILSIALVAMSLVAFNGVAQTVSNDNNTPTENVKGTRPDKKGQRGQKNPYEGLTLTDAQKTQLRQLEAKRQEARQQQMQSRREKKQQDMTARMEARKTAKKQYLDEVKAIVGPEQYVVFLENMYINGGGGRRDGKAIQQGQRGDKQSLSHNKNGKTNRQKDGKNRQDKGQRDNRQQSPSNRS